MLEVSPSRGEKEEQGSELPPANATIQGPYPPGDRKYRSRQNPTFQGELGSPLLSFLVSPQNSSLLGTRNGNCANPGKMSWVGQVPWAMGSIPARVEGCPEPPSSAPRPRRRRQSRGGGLQTPGGAETSAKCRRPSCESNLYFLAL